MNIFDEKIWTEKIKNPLWYLDLYSIQEELSKLHDSNRELYEKEKDKIYNFFEYALINNKISLGNNGKDFDLERKNIDTIVIHHTSGNGHKKITKDLLSAIHLLRLYAPNYANPRYKEDVEIKYKPIWSGHFDENKKQVFYAYHWIIRSNGLTERLLRDEEIGWHAGNWDINCKSVGIVFEGNFEKSIPNQIMIKSLIDLIRKNYSWIKEQNIFGHSEINNKTICPSKLFLSSKDRRGWKEKIKF